jgi:uncharacterized protein (TIGR00369 family)
MRRVVPRKPASTRRSASSRLKLENYRHPDQFGRWLGYQVLSLDSRKHVARVGLEIREDHLSPAGRVHGGVISALFDYACGAAVFSTLGPRDFCSTVELKVNYFRPIELGDSLEAKVQVVFRGKRLCVLQGYLYHKGAKEPLAMATATFNVVPAKI